MVSMTMEALCWVWNLCGLDDVLSVDDSGVSTTVGVLGGGVATGECGVLRLDDNLVRTRSRSLVKTRSRGLVRTKSRGLVRTKSCGLVRTKSCSRVGERTAGSGGGKASVNWRDRGQSGTHGLGTESLEGVGSVRDSIDGKHHSAGTVVTLSTVNPNRLGVIHGDGESGEVGNTIANGFA